MKTAATAAALVVLVALLVATPAMGGVGNVTIAVPESVAVSDPVTIVLTGLGNNSFNFTVAGPKDFLYNVNAVFINGTYRLQLTFNLDGDYLFTLASGNETTTKPVRVVCDDECQGKRLQMFYAISDERIQRWVILLIFLVIGAEMVRFIETRKDHQEMSRLMGLPAPRSRAIDGLRSMKLFMSPSHGARRVEVNPRLAFHEEKQSVLDDIGKHILQNNRPIGRDYEWEHGLVEKVRTYLVADQNLVDILTSQGRVEVPVAGQMGLEDTLSTMITIPNPDESDLAAPMLAGLDDFVQGRPETRARRDFVPSRHIAAWKWVKRAIGVFYALDGLMLVLIVAAYVGVYVEPLRPLWCPSPTDPVKVLLGLLAFVPLIAYAAYRRGANSPSRGVHRP